MSYALQIRITLGTDVEVDANELADVIGTGVQNLLYGMESMDETSGLEIIESEVYTY